MKALEVVGRRRIEAECYVPIILRRLGPLLGYPPCTRSPRV